MEPERVLWLAVIAEAVADIKSEPIGSVDYDAACEFFVARTGEWARSRADLAQLIGYHGDDLRRAGVAHINARRASEGLPPALYAVPKPVMPWLVPSGMTGFLPPPPKPVRRPRPKPPRPAGERRDVRAEYLRRFLAKHAA